MKKSLFFYLAIVVAALLFQLFIVTLVKVMGWMDGDVLPATVAAVAALIPSWFTSSFAFAWFGITLGVGLFAYLGIWGMKPPKWAKYPAYVVFAIAVGPFVYLVPTAHANLIVSFAKKAGYSISFANAWVSYGVGVISIALWLTTMIVIIYFAVKKGDIRD